MSQPEEEYRCGKFAKAVVTQKEWRQRHSGHEVVKFDEEICGVIVTGLHCVPCDKKLACKTQMDFWKRTG